MSNPKWDEQILVVPRVNVFGQDDEAIFEGILDDPDEVTSLTARINASYGVMRRGNSKDITPLDANAEINALMKQPIPYAIIKQGDRYFAYERLIGGGEDRLHNQISIGVGGHMNPIEGMTSFTDLLHENLSRELAEELDIQGQFTQQILGYINNETDPSLYHIGILVILELESAGTVQVKEKDQLDGRWNTLEELTAVYSRLESWSQIAVNVMKASE